MIFELSMASMAWQRLAVYLSMKRRCRGEVAGQSSLEQTSHQGAGVDIPSTPANFGGSISRSTPPQSPCGICRGALSGASPLMTSTSSPPLD